MDHINLSSACSSLVHAVYAVQHVKLLLFTAGFRHEDHINLPSACSSLVYAVQHAKLLLFTAGFRHEDHIKLPSACSSLVYAVQHVKLLLFTAGFQHEEQKPTLCLLLPRARCAMFEVAALYHMNSNPGLLVQHPTLLPAAEPGAPAVGGVTSKVDNGVWQQPRLVQCWNVDALQCQRGYTRATIHTRLQQVRQCWSHQV